MNSKAVNENCATIHQIAGEMENPNAVARKQRGTRFSSFIHFGLQFFMIAKPKGKLIAVSNKYVAKIVDTAISSNFLTKDY